MGKTPYNCFVTATKHPHFVLVWCEKAYSPGQDAYTFPLQTAVSDTFQFRNEGYLAVINRRQNAGSSDIALNSQDGYPRKFFLCNLDENDHAARLGLLTTMKQVRPLCFSRLHVSPSYLMLAAFSFLFSSAQFMEMPENNRFGYVYTINDDSDVTPPSNQLESMDVYMLDHQLVNFMQQVLENADQSFYQNNTESANDFFSGPAYPQCAIDSLGYPGDNNNN